MYDYQAPKNLLTGKNIIISGAGDGIGRAAAHSYAHLGATVILLGKTVSKLEQVYDEIVAKGCSEPAIYPLDLNGATEDDYNKLNQSIMAEFGALHGLLNNAGILGPRKPLENITAQQWTEVLQVNLTSTFLLTKALLPALKLADTASIIMTSSGVGRQGRAYWGAYAVSKFGIEGLTQVLAEELENTTNIRVNCINPKATNTAMRRTAYPSERPDTNPSSDEIMPLYTYLMGDDSKGINGKSIDTR
ncbi:MAG: YciK family oxidoreductase [Sinobacterium sp.]|jgi:NAD(P)-dependent dehydrogenase (short-subunit alcohol dehydrogenase family)|tara:strand:+ start:1401 stop:2141 length:741 start_codon:yes stop_codon:yes gene_type:complete